MNLKRVINSLIQNIDEFSQENILIAATNHQELLDRAIWRRFNTIIEVGYPGETEIKELIQLFTANYKNQILNDTKMLNNVAKLLIGKSPSDIKNILHNAIASCVIKNQKELEYIDLILGIYQFNNRGDLDIDHITNYLNQNGVTQNEIAEKLEVSIRQIRNYLKKK